MDWWVRGRLGVGAEWWRGYTGEAGGGGWWSSVGRGVVNGWMEGAMIDG